MTLKRWSPRRYRWVQEFPFIYFNPLTLNLVALILAPHIPIFTFSSFTP